MHRAIVGNKRKEEPNPLESKEKLSRGGYTCAEFEKFGLFRQRTIQGKVLRHETENFE